ncbi:MAG: hypothetical protein AAF982_11150, partial [Pseudomonadota bacterium]
RSLLLISQRSLDVYRFWVLGGLDGIEMPTLAALLPFFALGAAFAAVSIPRSCGLPNLRRKR